MSLATTSGMAGAGAAGAGAGGLVMAHQAHAVGVPQAQAHQHTTANATSSGPGAPPSMAALGADLIDKNQTGLSLKQVRNKQHLPIVAIDLYCGGDGHQHQVPVAYFPKKPEDPSKGEPPLFVGTVSNDVTFQANNETAHKTLRKYLSKTKGFSSLQHDSLSLSETTASSLSISSKTNKKGKNSTKTPSTATTTVVLEKPHRWLGLRRLNQAPDFVRTSAGGQIANIDGVDTDRNKVSNLNHAIAEESHAGVGISIENSTLDGVSLSKNDDFDRVLAKVRLHASKKAVTILPEEAVQIIFNIAQHVVAHKIKQSSSSQSSKTKNNKNATSAETEDEDENEIIEYPLAIAIPAWAMHDSCIEALLDATDGTGVIIPRSVAACAGALLPSLDGSVTPLLTRMNFVRSALQKEHQRVSQIENNPNSPFDDSMTLLLFGMSDTGFEATAIIVSTTNMTNISCLFSEFKVLSNVSYQNIDPISVMEKCTHELDETLQIVAPESDGPCAIIFYGSATEQEQIKARWDVIKNKQQDWSKVPAFVSPPDTVARGTAVMGAIAHGRLTKLSQTSNSSGKKKIKSHLGIRVQNVALAAVGLAFNYHGDDKENADKKWTPIKAIFDFDRQTPAGPHSIELNAAECAVRKERGYELAEQMSDDEFLKATAQYEGAKGIPAREDAALNLRIQVYEKWTRDGEWIKVGDPMEPLVMTTSSSDPKDSQREEITRVACESIVLELSLAITGMITSNLIGERTSVVVATKEARNSRIRWYLFVIFLILFCGGFLFKSWYDDYVLERDTKRLLAYYKHVVPGSIQDGDVHHARWTCYKFRNKKAKLWKKLEAKYGIPVLQAHEYLETEKGEGNKDSDRDRDDNTEEEPPIDLDNNDEKQKPIDLDNNDEKQKDTEDSPDEDEL